ncbi:MAG: polysaccharide pyruvyl transferase family protein [Methyloprofundus sp.]|nr:polysaccharide pyruvyl transferase family protein [Methyloprofundus sp.]
MPKKILTINECYSDNIGDQAISEAMKLFCQLDPYDQVDVSDFSFRVKLNRNHPPYNKKKNWKKNLPIFIKKLFFLVKNFNKARNVAKKRYDLAVIGGGQLVLSNASFSTSMFLFTVFLKFYGSKIKLVSVGVGKKFSFFDKLLFKMSLMLVDEVYVRDQQSVVNLKKNFAHKSMIVPDIAYFLFESFDAVPKVKNSYLISPVEYAVFERYHLEVGRSYLTEKEYFDEWIDIIKSTLEKGGSTKIYLAATTIKDLVFTQNLYDSLYGIYKDERELYLLDKVELQSYIKLIGQCENIISGRMHALILGHSNGLAVIPYNISQKIESYEKDYLKEEVSLLKDKLLETARVNIL